jgi:hypothetical protein
VVVASTEPEGVRLLEGDQHVRRQQKERHVGHLEHEHGLESGQSFEEHSQEEGEPEESNEGIADVEDDVAEGDV